MLSGRVLHLYIKIGEMGREKKYHQQSGVSASKPENCTLRFGCAEGLF
jgi:hypothetical protein